MRPVDNAILSVAFPSMSSVHVIRTIARLVYYEHCRVVAVGEVVAARFQMAAQELLENVVKYSTGPRVTLEVELLDSSTHPCLCARASNEASEGRLQEVDRRLSEIISTEEPLVLYDRLLREAAPQRNMSGLGLVRLRAEGNFNVEYSVRGHLLTISAHMRIHPTEGD